MITWEPTERTWGRKSGAIRRSRGPVRKRRFGEKIMS